MNVVGDRDTVVVSATLDGVADFACGGYLGRFDAEPLVAYPELILAACNGSGVPGGFDRSGAFSASPGGSHVLRPGPSPISQAVGVYTSDWMASAGQPSKYSGYYTYRPLDVVTTDTFLGALRFVWACAGLDSGSRFNNREKIVEHYSNAGNGVAVIHDGTIPPAAPMVVHYGVCRDSVSTSDNLTVTLL
jgi:hypothetical protein